MSLTKNDVVYDREKVGVGDIVEFDEYSIGLFGKTEFLCKRVGIVTKVDLDILWVMTQDIHDKTLEQVGIPIERANELRLVYRSVLNVKAGEKYGEIN